jgi:Tfp pilus assembly protein PilX
MANKRFLLAILAVALVFGMTVIGCEDGVQLVAFERAKAVEWVIASIDNNDGSPTLNGKTVLHVAWMPTKNSVSYDVYLQNEEGTYHLGTVSLSHFMKEIPSEYFDNPTESIRFGVTATDFDENHVASNIVWSQYINVPSGYWWLY